MSALIQRHPIEDLVVLSSTVAIEVLKDVSSVKMASILASWLVPSCIRLVFVVFPPATASVNNNYCSDLNMLILSRGDILPSNLVASNK